MNPYIVSSKMWDQKVFQQSTLISLHCFDIFENVVDIQGLFKPSVRNYWGQLLLVSSQKHNIFSECSKTVTVSSFSSAKYRKAFMLTTEMEALGKDKAYRRHTFKDRQIEIASTFVLTDQFRTIVGWLVSSFDLDFAALFQVYPCLHNPLGPRWNDSYHHTSNRRKDCGCHSCMNYLVQYPQLYRDISNVLNALTNFHTRNLVNHIRNTISPLP